MDKKTSYTKIGDLFEKDFIKEFYNFTLLKSHIEIFNEYKENRIEELKKNYKDYRVENVSKIEKEKKTKYEIYFEKDKPSYDNNEMNFANSKTYIKVDEFIPLKPLDRQYIDDEKITTENVQLQFDNYIKKIFTFSLRMLLYKHYDYSIKKNKTLYKKYLCHIMKYYFNLDKINYLKNKRKLFHKYLIDGQIKYGIDEKELKKNLTEKEFREYKKNQQKIQNEQFCNDEIRYLVITDIFTSMESLNPKIIKEIDNDEDVVRYVCKKVLLEELDSSKKVEKLLRPQVIRAITDIDNSNSAMYSYYQSYERDINEIKNEIGIEDFLDLNPDERKLIMSYREIDSIYLTEYLSTITLTELSKSSSSIAYNILEYQHPNISREDIRKRCSRGKENKISKITKRLNKLEKIDNKIIEYNNKIYINAQAIMKAYSKIQKIIK